MSRNDMLPDSPDSGWVLKLHPAVESDLAVGRVFDRIQELVCFAALLRGLDGWPPSESAGRALAADLGIEGVAHEGIAFSMITFDREPGLPKGARAFVWFDGSRATVWLLHVAPLFPPSLFGSVRRRAAGRLREIRGFLQDQGGTS